MDVNVGLKKAASTAVTIACLLFFVCRAAGSENDNLITSLEIEGLIHVDKTVALSRISTKVGENYSRIRLRDDLRQLYDTGFFKDLKIQRSHYENGWKITFIVTEKSVIRKVEITGNTSVPTSEIVGRVKFKVGDFLNADLLGSSLGEIKLLYEANGYYLAQVEPRLFYESAKNEVVVSLEVREGNRIAVESIDISGNLSIGDSDLISRMKTKVDQVLASETLADDIATIESYYKDQGFFEVRVSSPALRYDNDKKRAAVVVNIQEGPRTMVEIKGNSQVEGKEIEVVLSIIRDRSHDMTSVEENRLRIVDLYRSRGYMLSQVRSEVISQDGQTRVVFQIDEGKKVTVKKIYFRGNKAFSDDKLKGAMETKEERFLFDATFDQKKFSRDLDAIRKLYEDEGYFSVDVHRPQFFYEDGGEKVIIVIPITEGVRVAVGVAGNKAIGEKEIKDKLTIMKSHSYDEATIGENVREIISLYKEKGYYLVQVEPEVRIFKEKEEVTITFNIREGRPVKIKGIEINGNEAFPDGALIGQMDTKTDLNPVVDFLAGWGTMKDEVFANDLRKIRSFYRNNGYVEAEVISHRFEFSPDGSELRASVDVHEGPQFHLGKIDLTGNLAFTAEELRKMVESQDEEVYNVGKFEADLDRLREFYGKGGYVNARLELETKIDEAKKMADLKVHIKEGRQFFLESVRAEGNKATNYKVIRREIHIPDGGIFDTDEVRKSSRRLFNLRYFKSIALDVEPGELADRLVLVVRVEEDQTGTFNLSAGWNQDAGLSGSTSIGWRNMFGSGQEASIQGEIRQTEMGQVAPPTYSLDLQLTEPWLLDVPINFTVGGRFLYQPRPSFGYTENTREGRANLGFPVSILEPEADRLFVGYRLGFTAFTDVDLSPQSSIPLTVRRVVDEKGQGIDFVTSSLSLSFVRNLVDFSFDPNGGYYLSPAVEFAGLGGDNSFLKPEVDFRVYSKFPFDWVFGARLRGGWVTDLKSGKEEDVIATERFRAGNVFTLRGYGDGLIFPLQNNREGGAARFLANVEEKITLIPNTLKLIFFYDVGNVWSSAKNVSLRDLRHSVGVGVRIGIPLLGVLYLDYGWPIITDDPSLQSYRDGSLHFNIGRSFDIMDGR